VSISNEGTQNAAENRAKTKIIFSFIFKIKIKNKVQMLLSFSFFNLET